MPETSIGFIPDVGGTWLLSRAPGELGTHLALTAARFGPADAIACGFADHYLPAAKIPALLGALRPDRLGQVVESLAEPAPASALRAQRPWIDDCYSADTAGEILGRLRARTEPVAGQAAGQLQANSPTAVTVAPRALRQARQLATLREELDQEQRISTAALDSRDLIEGIRALVIDKDRQPRWSPATLAEVTGDVVDRYFAAAHTESRMA
jgi:enoyl-CoA hydratase